MNVTCGAAGYWRSDAVLPLVWELVLPLIGYHSAHYTSRHPTCTYTHTETQLLECHSGSAMLLMQANLPV
jgi:hypothetical protein